MLIAAPEYNQGSPAAGSGSPPTSRAAASDWRAPGGSADRLDRSFDESRFEHGAIAGRLLHHLRLIERACLGLAWPVVRLYAVFQVVLRDIDEMVGVVIDPLHRPDLARPRVDGAPA